MGHSLYLDICSHVSWPGTHGTPRFTPMPLGEHAVTAYSMLHSGCMHVCAVALCAPDTIVVSLKRGRCCQAYTRAAGGLGSDLVEYVAQSL